MAVEYKQNAPVLYGAGAINELGDKLKEWGVEKALVMYDQGIKGAGIDKKVLDQLDAAGIPYVTYDQIPPDPPDTVVNECGEIAKKENVDAIIGLGGGSCMDAAKGVNFYVSNDLTDIRPYIDGPPIPQAPLKLKTIAIPTTSGTGSEVTFVAVLSDTEKGVKGGVFSPSTLAILDPELCLTVPPHITTMTALDALAHACESYTSIAANPKADILDLAAISMIFKYLPIAYKDGSNLEARSQLMLAANFAGMGFSDTMIQIGSWLPYR